MFTRIIGTAIITLAVSVAAFAQQPAPAGPSPTRQPQTPKPSAPQAAPVETATQVRPEPMGQSLNLKLELTITDQTGAGEPIKKIVSAVVADRANGYIRSMTGPNRLNVDATPTMLAGGNVRLRIGLEYTPRQPTSGEAISALNESVTVVLEPGKPLMISQAADPLSDRKITVEVRVSVVK